MQNLSKINFCTGAEERSIMTEKDTVVIAKDEFEQLKAEELQKDLVTKDPLRDC